MAPVASWRVEPDRIHWSSLVYRQVDPAWPPLYHAAGEAVPTQDSGRWHEVGTGYAQYLSLSPAGAWAELIRSEGIRGNARAREYLRNMWMVYVDEPEIADLSTFDAYEQCGIDPRLAVGRHAEARLLAEELRAAGYRGLLSPSAALSGAINLTLFGERYEKVLESDLEQWPNPDPALRTPCALVAPGFPPDELVLRTTFPNQPHAGYRYWLDANGHAIPGDPP